ncbi:phage tail family protein, partial [Candidatus Darwinibacter acetoxidans]
MAMQAVARSSGYPIPVLQQQRKEVMALGIAEQEATQMMTRFMQAQLDTADAAKIARIAQDAGTVASMNSSEATAQITEAIAKLRPELLTAFGFTRNLNDIYGDYARTVGKTASSLSEVEKKQAMLNYIFREGEKIAGAYESAMGTVGKKMGSLEKLELSKKLMQELKTALARPLLLPAFGYWVDTMHNAFERAKAWVEANQATLIGWGQTAKNVVAGIVRGVQWITNAFIKNWGAIRFAATAFISYLVLSRAINLARTATLAFSIAVSVLRGQSVITSGVLGALSTVVQTYRLQMALAPVATNIFTASLYSLQAGLYAVWTALGPVGWVILAISAAIAGGSYLWSKYSASVRAANDAAREAQMQKLADQQAAVAKAAMKAVKGEDSLADAIKKAGKAAARTLMPFDEIHTIQKDMAGAGMGEIGDLDTPAIDMPDLGFPGMGDFMDGFGAALDELKPTFKGFLSWMWEGAKELFNKYFEGWDWWEILLLGLGPAPMLGVLIYKNWDKVADWAKEKFGPMWDGVIVKWGNFTAWAGDMWDAVKAKWGDFKTWCSETWQALWDPVKQKWSDFKTWAGNFWDSVKEKWNEFKVWVSDVWGAFWNPVKEKWGIFRSWAKELLAPVKQKWNEFKLWARGIWDGLLKKWNEIKRWSLWTWIKNKVDWLKNVFNFKWSLPKIKLPRFKVSWSKAGFWGK